MVDIFQEVEEDLRAEKMRKLAVRYGAAALGIVVIIVGVTGAWQGWQWWQAKHNSKAAEAYMRTAEAAKRQRAQGGPANTEAEIAELDRLSLEAPNGYRSLAQLSAAALQFEKPDQRAALETWNRAVSDTQGAPEFQQLASLMWVAHQIDTGDPNTIRVRLDALTREASPWTPLARELLAVLNVREGKQDLAVNELRRMTSSSLIPTGLSGRAASLQARLGGQ